MVNFAWEWNKIKNSFYFLSVWLTCILYIVAVAPKKVTIKEKTDELKAGSTATLTCEVGSSNPEPELSWWMDGLEVTENITKVCKSAVFDGRSCTTELSLNLTADMDGRQYTCQATNVPLQLSVSDVMTLNVQCKYSADDAIALRGHASVLRTDINYRVLFLFIYSYFILQINLLSPSLTKHRSPRPKVVVWLCRYVCRPIRIKLSIRGVRTAYLWLKISNRRSISRICIVRIPEFIRAKRLTVWDLRQ